METISQVMMRDHDKIVSLLNDFGNCIDLDKQILKKAFEIFRWELEKHLFTEEKVIFISYEGNHVARIFDFRMSQEVEGFQR